jgi:hypothetical protein
MSRRTDMKFRFASPGIAVRSPVRLREKCSKRIWLPKDADQVRMLKAFADGRRRIIAVAERRIRLRPGEPVRLTADDFRIRR